MEKKPYGSGYFGEWIQDEFGLPAYRYTCDQRNDPKASSPVNEFWRPKTEHLHQIGNDRLIGVVSNYGHIQVRQDEGSPKFLNDHDPENGIYAGGFGYLTDGETILSTYYPGHTESFDRIFGMGYYCKSAEANGLKAEQTIFAPFGDDPLLISQVKISNNRKTSVDLRWIEYWGCEMYQFSYKAFIMGLISRKTTVPALRRQINLNFEHKFTLLPQYGILATKHFKGLPLSKKLKWGIMKFFMGTFFRKLSGGSIRSPVKESVFEDTSPPPTFLVSLDASVDGMSTNPNKFFEDGDILSPPGLKTPLALDIEPTGPLGGLFLEQKLHLDPGETHTLYFAYGYLPEGFLLDTLLSKYRSNLPELLQKSCEQWKINRIKLTLADEPWVDRELQWHNYYLRSNLTYDSFFKEHILSQGHVYQYLIGFQGAARDPLQHALPFIYSKPEIVKEIIRYTLKEVKSNGLIPYGICGSGMVLPAPYKPSDLELWLLWLTSEYVLATRDIGFLDETVPTYPVYGPRAGKATVIELLERCYNHFLNVTGTGKHGLQRLSNGDWNDGVVHGNVPSKKIGAITKQGESVLNAAMATYVLDIYARLLTYIGEIKSAEDTQIKAEAQREAVRAQWTGKWFKRAWLSEELQWIGVDELWLEPQPWAIIGAAATPKQEETLVQVIDQEVRQPSKIGATLLNKGIKKGLESPGMGTAGGVWPSINGTLVWALARVNGQLAWDEWKKNTLAVHAESYPDVWYGIWSGPDTYNSHHSNYPGQTIFVPPELKVKSSGIGGVKLFWTDFPISNMHPHAWPLYDIVKLIGVEFTEEGFILAPCLSKDEYEFSSPLLGLTKSKHSYSGYYAPQTAGIWKIEFLLTDDEIKRLNYLEINGKEVKIVREGQFIIFTGASTLEKPLQWTLKEKSA